MAMSRYRAAKIARGEWLVFLDGNMIPVPGWLEAYPQSFCDHAADVVSGARYCVQIAPSQSDSIMALSSLLGVDPADLFQERICGRLAAHSRPGTVSIDMAREV